MNRAAINLVITFLAIYSFSIFNVMDNFEVFVYWCFGVIFFLAIQSVVYFRRKIFFGITYFLVGLFCLLFFIRTPGLSGYQSIMAIGSSSCPTICNNDLAVARTDDFEPARGMMILMYPKESNAIHYAKRVHGLPGDSILLCASKVFINGYLYNSENNWIGKSVEAGSCTSPQHQFVLGDNQFFVLGDNSHRSIDSRSFGSIDRSQIAGHLIYKVIKAKNSLNSVPLDVVFRLPE